jgi:hypothetical protein
MRDDDACRATTRHKNRGHARTSLPCIACPAQLLAPSEPRPRRRGRRVSGPGAAVVGHPPASQMPAIRALRDARCRLQNARAATDAGLAVSLRTRHAVLPHARAPAWGIGPAGSEVSCESVLSISDPSARVGGASWLVRGLGKTSCHFTEVRLRPATRQTNRSHVFTFIGHSVALDASSPACRLPRRCPGGNRLPISASGFGRGLISVPTE